MPLSRGMWVLVSYDRGVGDIREKFSEAYVWVPVSCLCRSCTRLVGLATPDEEMLRGQIFLGVVSNCQYSFNGTLFTFVSLKAFKAAPDRAGAFGQEVGPWLQFPLLLPRWDL